MDTIKNGNRKNLSDISLHVQAGNAKTTADLVTQALGRKVSPTEILTDGLAVGFMEVKKRFYRCEILDSEVLVAERAIKAGIEVLNPRLEKKQNPFLGTVITGTMEGDIRDTEKVIISAIMQSLDLKVIDLGISIPNTRFIEAAVEAKANIISCNTSLTIFLPKMKSLIQAAEQAKIRDKTKILLSGGPVTAWFCKYIDADMYAPDIIKASKMAADYCKTLEK